MLYSILVENEMLDFAKRFKKECLLVKVDLTKAYDFVSWEYLMYVLKRMCFGPNRLKWLEDMVFTSSMYALVNERYTLNFLASRGLRQGDPLSPFLFIIAVKGLASLVHNVTMQGEFQDF